MEKKKAAHHRIWRIRGEKIESSVSVPYVSATRRDARLLTYVGSTTRLASTFTKSFTTARSLPVYVSAATWPILPTWARDGIRDRPDGRPDCTGVRTVGPACHLLASDKGKSLEQAGWMDGWHGYKKRAATGE